jgi:hypothetical protein
MSGTFLNLNLGNTLNSFGVYVLSNLFSTFCFFYCVYFNAKSLKSVELQRPVTFSDYAGEFFLICLSPIGVWIIQPRINEMFGETSQKDCSQIKN